MPLNAHSAHGLDLSHAVPDGHWFFRDSDIRITSCCTDVRHCQPGDLFVVLDDPHVASQDTIDLAVERGAAAILSERLLPNMIPQYVVDDCREALGTISHCLAGDPTSELCTVGIAGTVGKSVTRELLQSIFRSAGQPAEGLETDSSGRQTALSIARQLAESRAVGRRRAVLECGTQAIAAHHLSGTQFDALAVTNVHRVAGHSVRQYQANTLRVLQHRKPDGFVVLNADDRVCQELIETIDAPALTVGLDQPADITGQLIERHASEQTFMMHTGSDSVVLRTSMIGDGHLYNCLTATAISLALGIDMTHIVRGIEAVDSLSGRLERIECGQPFGVFVEQRAESASIAYSLSTLRSVARGRVHCLLGVSPEMPSVDRARLGRMVERFADRCVLTGERLDERLPLRISHDVLDGFQRPAQAQLLPDRAKAICWLLSQADPGDMVLLAGGRPSRGPDDVWLTDTDVARFWLYHVDDPADCPWVPA